MVYLKCFIFLPDRNIAVFHDADRYSSKNLWGKKKKKFLSIYSFVPNLCVYDGKIDPFSVPACHL